MKMFPRHQLPPVGWERVPNLPEFIRQIVLPPPLNGVDGKNGKDGRDGVDGKDGRDGVDGKDGANGKDGKDGRDGIDGRSGKDGLNGKDGKAGADGKKGDKGEDGVGIQAINAYGQDIEIKLTDGRKNRFRTGSTIQGMGGGGSSSGGVESKQEVFIGTQPVIDYPAIAFSPVAGYSGLYLQSVNVP